VPTLRACGAGRSMGLGSDAMSHARTAPRFSRQGGGWAIGCCKGAEPACSCRGMTALIDCLAPHPDTCLPDTELILAGTSILVTALMEMRYGPCSSSAERSRQRSNRSSRSSSSRRRSSSRRSSSRQGRHRVQARAAAAAHLAPAWREGCPWTPMHVSAMLAGFVCFCLCRTTSAQCCA